MTEQEIKSVIKLLEDVLMSSCTVCKVLIMFVLIRRFYLTAGGAAASEKPPTVL